MAIAYLFANVVDHANTLVKVETWLLVPDMWDIGDEGQWKKILPSERLTAKKSKPCTCWQCWKASSGNSNVSAQNKHLGSASYWSSRSQSSQFSCSISRIYTSQLDQVDLRSSELTIGIQLGSCIFRSCICWSCRSTRQCPVAGIHSIGHRGKKGFFRDWQWKDAPDHTFLNSIAPPTWKQHKRDFWLVSCTITC